MFVKQSVMTRRIRKSEREIFPFVYFVIFWLLLFGYSIDFLIYRDWSYLYMTAFAPFILALVLKGRNYLYKRG
ncbi:hypothetical protein A9C19_03510 [Bacillus weihaiensis]|uniref:Uncharacterized protein n=1 Tax=Bacillus weihaiensis TaxID=1547283 RepID=A0A1L3MNM0_9BACI|nr:hypothetical protein A9C19_03510 [Bacillus weihaiensis]